MNSTALAIFALVPVITGPFPQEPRMLDAKLCSGGTISIPVGNPEDSLPEPCAQKACHAASCRKKFDLAQ